MGLLAVTGCSPSKPKTEELTESPKQSSTPEEQPLTPKEQPLTPTEKAQIIDDCLLFDPELCRVEEETEDPVYDQVCLDGMPESQNSLKIVVEDKMLQDTAYTYDEFRAGQTPLTFLSTDYRSDFHKYVQRDIFIAVGDQRDKYNYTVEAEGREELTTLSCEARRYYDVVDPHTRMFGRVSNGHRWPLEHQYDGGNVLYTFGGYVNCNSYNSIPCPTLFFIQFDDDYFTYSNPTNSEAPSALENKVLNTQKNVIDLLMNGRETNYNFDESVFGEDFANTDYFTDTFRVVFAE